MRTSKAGITAIGLGIALFTIAIQNPRLGFQLGHHGVLSSQGFAIAQNQSLDHRFLSFTHYYQTSTGETAPFVYARFPVLPFATISMAIWMAGSELENQVYAARLIIILFWLAALFMAYRIALALLQSPWIAFTAAALSFSSFYIAYYSDIIYNDVPAMFGVLLLVYCVIKYSEPPRWSILIGGALLSLSLGWQPLAVLGAWLVVETITFIRRRADGRQVRTAVFVAIFAVVYSFLLLGLNVVNESYATGHKITASSTLTSMRWRLGLEGASAYERYQIALRFPNFVALQCYRIACCATPWPVASALSTIQTCQFCRERRAVERRYEHVLSAFLGLLVVGLCVYGCATCVSRRRALSIMILSPFVWAFGMRFFVAFHDFQAIFFVTLVLAFYVILLGWLSDVMAQFSMRAAATQAVLVIVSLALFVVAHSNLSARKEAEIAAVAQHTSDLLRIRSMLGKDKSVFVDEKGLSNEVPRSAVTAFLPELTLTAADHAAYALTSDPAPIGNLLTPENRKFFLFALHDTIK